MLQVSRNDAEARVRHVLEGRKPVIASVDATEVSTEQALNIEKYATDQIRGYIPQFIAATSWPT